jgi:GNAT superfamily N-acetyltransferase
MDRNMQEMYREMTRATPGGFVVERSGLVMVGAPLGTIVTNMVIVSGPTDVDSIRRETARVFGEAALPFSVHTRAHADAALEADLEASGFREINATPGMTLGPEDGASRERVPRLDIRAVTNDVERCAYGEVMAESYAVYGTPPESTRGFFDRMDAVCGPTTQAYLGWVDGVPVAGAILYLSHGIAGIGWVGTRPQVFGRGYGAALTWHVVDEGFRRGAPLVNLQASPMGAPLYQRMGFATPTHYRMFIDVA